MERNDGNGKSIQGRDDLDFTIPSFLLLPSFFSPFPLEIRGSRTDTDITKPSNFRFEGQMSEPDRTSNTQLNHLCTFHENPTDRPSIQPRFLSLSSCIVRGIYRRRSVLLFGYRNGPSRTRPGRTVVDHEVCDSTPFMNRKSKNCFTN